MANLTTRSLTTSTVSTANLNKGSALTIAEMDSNFLNLNTDKIDTTGPQTFSGDLTITTGTSSAVGSIILKEAANNGTNSITLKANVAMASDLNFILPPDAGSNGYGLVTDGSGNLSWAESAGDITAVIAGDGLTGGATSGSATINVVGGTGIDANADDISIDDTVVATLSGSQILTNKTLTTPIISSISNTGTLTLPTSTDTLVGRATTDTLTNKTLTSPVLNTGVSGTAIKDEDNMSSDSDTHLATQQSIKAYVDSQVATKDTIAELNDVDTTGIANNKILKYNSTSSNWEMADDGGSGIALTDLSVGAEGTAAGDGSLAYNNSTGVFTYTPPVLSGLSGDTDDIAEGSTNLYYTNSRVDARIQNSSINELSDVDTTGVANNKILKYNSTSGNFEVADDSGGIALTDLSVSAEGTASGDGAIAYNNTTGVFTYTPPVLSGLTGDTDDIAEGSTNLYFTNARADARVNLQTGSNLDLSGVSTTNLGEGDNQYFTQSRARTSLSVGAEASASGDGALSYNDTTGVFTYTPPTLAGLGGIADVVSDTTPELGGTLDILGNDIKSSTANVVISADANDKDVILKAKDAGATLNTVGTFHNNARIQKTTPGGSTTETLYDAVLDTGSVRIGSSTEQFSNDGTAPDTQSNYPFTGMIITNGTKKTWPQLALISYGGANPLYNRFGISSHQEFPNALVNFKAARGTEGSATAIQSGDTIGSFQFNSYDGNDFGGSSQRSSASIEVKANENHSSSNDRAAKVTFNVMPTGGDGSKASRDTVIEAAGDSVIIGNQTDAKHITMDSSNGVLDFTDTVIKLGEVGSAPSTAADHGFVYAKDDSGTAEVYVKDGAGNETKISPHNQTGEWEYYSVNKSTGKTVRINMEKMIRKLEEITGETFIENE